MAAGPLLDPRSRTWTLLAGGACLLPLLLQMPGVLATAVGAVAVLITAASWRKPLSTAVRLLLAIGLIGAVLAQSRFGFGRDTACGLLAAMLAIKPAETFRLRDGRSLLGFALFAPFATFLLDQGPLSLLLGLLGATLALAALLRLAELESGDDRHLLPPWQRFVTVWKLVAIGLPLALAAFWLFPRLGSPLWGVPDRAVARPGLSDRMTPGEWLDLLNDDTVVLRAQFHGAAPAQSEMYWRGPVLWDFDGATWTQPRWLRGLPPAPVRDAATRWDYDVELEPTDRRQLVALDLPTAPPDGTRLSLDYGLYAPRELDAVTRWQMHSAPPAAFEPALKHVLRQMALTLPDGYNPRTVALGRQWRREAGTNDAAIVQRALQWVRRDFAYTLDVPPSGRNGVDEFLFQRRAGYCEHFSSAFVVLMRAAGIPARVVTGYAGGYRNPIGGYWEVRRSDAHAWAEVWLPRRGWVRVDPTAAVAPDRIYDTLADRAPGAVGLLGGLALTPAYNVGDWLRHGWNDFVLGFDAERQRHLLASLGMVDADAGRLLAFFVAVASLAILWMAWLTARAERERDPVLRAWRRLAARYARLGLARAPHEPAGAWMARVTAARPADAPALQELIGRFTNWRYAAPVDPHADPTLARALRRHRPAPRS
jgi:transglutaminase-like putative cysteine protease